MEEFLAEELFKAVKENPELKVTIVLDRSRAMRDDRQGMNSHSLLSKLIKDVSKYKTNIIQFIRHILTIEMLH